MREWDHEWQNQIATRTDLLADELTVLSVVTRALGSRPIEFGNAVQNGLRNSGDSLELAMAHLYIAG